jgi:very-short-patch-repair endonuclease
MTKAEGRIWSRLRARRFQGYSFRRQLPIGPYIVDFVCLDARLIIEIDGGQHASTEAERDKKRDAWLRAQGFVILRYWNNDVLTNLNGVLEHIADALSQPPPPSLTLPQPAAGLPASGNFIRDRTPAGRGSVGGGDRPNAGQ